MKELFKKLCEIRGIPFDDSEPPGYAFKRCPGCGEKVLSTLAQEHADKAARPKCRDITSSSVHESIPDIRCSTKGGDLILDLTIVAVHDALGKPREDPIIARIKDREGRKNAAYAHAPEKVFPFAVTTGGFLSPTAVWILRDLIVDVPGRAKRLHGDSLQYICNQLSTGVQARSAMSLLNAEMVLGCLSLRGDPWPTPVADDVLAEIAIADDREKFADLDRSATAVDLKRQVALLNTPLQVFHDDFAQDQQTPEAAHNAGTPAIAAAAAPVLSAPAPVTSVARSLCETASLLVQRRSLTQTALQLPQVPGLREQPLCGGLLNAAASTFGVTTSRVTCQVTHHHRCHPAHT
jgi:hypothetical protein